MSVRSALTRSVVLFSVVLAVGCATGQRDMSGKDVEEGAGSLTAARKFLEGRWTLESFEVFPPGKAPITVKGSGTLNYDDFGNMRIDIRADEQTADLLRAAGIEIRDGAISSDGRTVVNMQNKTLTYVLAGQPVGVPTAVAGPLAPSRPRHWEVQGDILTLSTKDEAGKTLSMARWKRMP